MGVEQQNGYSPTAKLLHWVSAAVILWATSSGLFAAAFADEAVRAWLASLNVSLTTLFVPVFALRVVCRLVAKPPAAPHLSPAMRRSARLGHAALYVLTGIVLASGVLMMRQDIDVFEWVSLPRPLRNAALNRLFGGVHRVASVCLAVLVLGHVLAVVRHERRGTPVLQRMLWSGSRSASRAERLEPANRLTEGPARDSGGHALFSHGDTGAAHVLAHRLADAGRADDGYRMLGAWLEGRRGSGSEWVHLQFHMAVFELAVGRWDDACARFHRHILPAAAAGDDALTDAPGLLWRLMLAASRPVRLPWNVLRRIALRRLGNTGDSYVELHNVLALAGSGDVASIDRWLDSMRPSDRPGDQFLLRNAALALRAFATRDYQRAADLLDAIVPQLHVLGGSREQNRLFGDIADESRRRALGGRRRQALRSSGYSRVAAVRA